MQTERSPLDTPRSVLSELPNGAWLAAVVAAHGLVLGGIAFGLSKPPEPVTPPTVAGIVIATAPAAPGPKAAVPKPKAKPKPRQAPKPNPRPPAPPAPPSERAVTVPAAPPAPVDSDVLPIAPQDEVPLASSDVTDVDSSASGDPSASAVGEAEDPPITQPRSDASHLSNPAPQYPTLSRRFGEEGRVLLDVYILPDGTVGDMRLNTSSGFKRLDEAALTAVRRWRFVPARRGDEPIPFWYVQPVTFSLDR